MPVMSGTCSTDESLCFLIAAGFCDAPETLSIIDDKRSRCSINTPIRSGQKGDDHSEILLLRRIILRTPGIMHHLGSALSLMYFMKRDYKGKSEQNISRWQKYSAHTKVYIFQLKNNYSSSEPFVCACFVVLTKRKGPFITMNGGRHCESSPYCTWGYSATARAAESSAQRRWWFAAHDLWFCRLRKQTCPACVNISRQRKKSCCSWRRSSRLVTKVNGPGPHFTF